MNGIPSSPLPWGERGRVRGGGDIFLKILKAPTFGRRGSLQQRGVVSLLDMSNKVWFKSHQVVHDIGG
jgi:hypothetical protein